MNIKALSLVCAMGVLVTNYSLADVKLVKTKDAKLGTVLELSNSYVKLRLFPDKGRVAVDIAA